MKKIIIIGGATASGKSAFALNLAEIKGGVIINADSRQVYNATPILTAQPPKADMADIPHRLYSFLQPDIHCSVGIWLEAAKHEINIAFEDGKTPILVGGTGMYLKCLMNGIAPIPDIPQEIREKTREIFAEIGNAEFHILLAKLDPIAGEKLHISDSQRMMRAYEVMEETGLSIYEWRELPHEKFYPQEYFSGYFINPPREILYERCNNRFQWMIDNGAIDEVKTLLAMNLSQDLPVMKSLGVPEIQSFLNNEISLDEAASNAQQSTRRYAKRQVTWFKHQLPKLEEV